MGENLDFPFLLVLYKCFASNSTRCGNCHRVYRNWGQARPENLLQAGQLAGRNYRALEVSKLITAITDSQIKKITESQKIKIIRNSVLVPLP